MFKYELKQNIFKCLRKYVVLYIMAEIAIPMLALGSMYILANQNQRKSENYENLNNRPVPEGRVPKGVPVNPV